MRIYVLLALASVSAALPVRVAPRGGGSAGRKAAAGWPAPSPSISFNDVNILQLTDVHSWLSGHQHEKGMGADYADVLSFYQHLKAMADLQGKDLWFFNSGDIVEGTGLSDATKAPGQLITPIISTMPYDAITCGNHELYHNETIFNMQQSGFIASWKGRYLTGNIHDSSTGDFLGSNYLVLTGTHGKRLLVFGFLYNMLEHCGAVTVTMIQDVVQEAWFRSALSKEGNTTHAIVLLAHMDVADPLTEVLRKAIRAVQPYTPVVFLTGHTHYRGYNEPDARCVSMESGKFLDTVGLLQFDLPYEDKLPVHFNHTFVTPNVDTFMQLTATSAKTFTTPEAQVMKASIAKVRLQLGLDETVGCSPMDFHPDAPLNSSDSLWRLFMDKVLPQELYEKSKVSTSVFVGHTGSLRYSMFAGKVTIDDTYIVSPFHDTFTIAHDIPGNILATALKHVAATPLDPSHDRSSVTLGYLPVWVSSLTPDQIDSSLSYDVVCVSFDTPFAEEKLREAGAKDASFTAFREGDSDDRNVWERFVRDSWPCKKQ